ncbi:hydantoinase/carbamoylase family amidase [Achromobacter insuavis]|uniref:OHCU decarboxylase n=1 Tax=Achromobacter insuavis AXX-A TaxID=1003200 RepID=F7T3P6_9BURK|nr:hydantoinase/carbamoylase family amidase [Achromobacter insuavis]EGP45067.1 OHCU decarboxylase [Achromobacter insuavis AXX-A]
MAHTLAQFNDAAPQDAAAMLADLYPHAPWAAQQAVGARPMHSVSQLQLALQRAVDDADVATQLALLRAQPALDAGADAAARIADHAARFGFPFVLSRYSPRGASLQDAQRVQALERRQHNAPDDERREALRQLHRDAEVRLHERFGVAPDLGNDIWDWQEKLSAHSDPGYAENGQLTVTYLTDAHRACAQRISHWMRDCGFDEVGIDAVGNVVGRYHAVHADAPILMSGSHYDTVRNAGKYDGRLGIFVPMACVRALHRQGRRLPYAIEVIAFSEEEGQRYPATFLGSGALIGDFQPRWLEQKDADGISMREAMAHAGLCVDDIPKLKRDPARYLGFVEVHIEQGPVLNEMGLPLGVVTSINGCVRYRVRIHGTACHAGTTPMDRRRDAAVAAAELIVFVEGRAARDGDSVGTVGMLEVPNGSINVVPGECRFSLDLRAPSDPQRDALATDVLAELDAICQRRGLRYTLEETMRAAAAPSAPAWQQRWERAVQAQGVPVHCMPSGAGHDAMKLHEIMPQAMLFVRGQNAGISHNPLESTTNHDMQLAAQAMQRLLDDLANEATS